MRYILLNLLFIPFLANAQQVSFRAVCDATEVAVGEAVAVSFRLENADLVSFTPPDLKQFDVMGPSTSQSVSYVNGAKSSAYSYSYILYPKREGKYTIAAAVATTSSGQKLTSQPLTIKVVKASSNNTNTANNNSANAPGNYDGKMFVRTEVSNLNPVVGEQITVDLKIYTLIGIEQLGIVKAPHAANVYSHDVRIYEGGTRSESYNGKQYTTKILHRTVMFPSKSGKITIEPAMAQAGILENDVYGPFGLGQIVPHNLHSEAVELNVQPLTNTPADFTGAVGEYDVQAYIENSNITSDDVSHLHIRVQGKGDLKQVLAPELEIEHQALESFPPQIEESIREADGVLGGTKMFEYILSPRAIGDIKLTARFNYYSPSQKRFLIRDTTFLIKVTQGKNALPTIAEIINGAAKPMHSADSAQLAEMNAVQFKMQAPQTETTLSLPSKPFFGTWLFWTLCTAPFFALGGAIYWQTAQAQKALVQATETGKQQVAFQAANQRLTQAQKFLQNGDSKAFFGEISKVLDGYFSDKLGIPVADLSKEIVKNHLQNQAVQPSTIQGLFSVWQSCEMAAFAGLGDANSMQKIQQETAHLLNELEKTSL